MRHTEFFPNTFFLRHHFPQKIGIRLGLPILAWNYGKTHSEKCCRENLVLLISGKTRMWKNFYTQNWFKVFLPYAVSCHWQIIVCTVYKDFDLHWEIPSGLNCFCNFKYFKALSKLKNFIFKAILPTNPQISNVWANRPLLDLN